MKKHYKSEIEAMRDFWEELGIIPDYSCNTDGCIYGTLVEIKLNGSGGIPIKQLKRYIDSYNAVALPLPRYSLFVNINQREFTLIDNKDWGIMIEDKWKNPQDLMRLLNSEDYMKGWIDEFSIVAYNDLFYSKHLSAKKEDFIEEIRNPKELNIEPYQWDEVGEMERSILDCLGGIALKKRLGAFFTPDEYVEIFTKYVRNAISRVPDDHDYIILDRCAGTGNLQKFLESKIPGALSHCILNTYVYAEWTTLKGLYEGRVRYIIPHNKNYKDPDGLLSDGDALTEEFDKILTDIIENERKKVNGKLVVIGGENNPFSEPQAEATRSGKTHKQGSWVKEQMKKNKCGVASNDLSNQFIWSMLKYADEYVVFSPIKYWKSQHLLDGKFNEGYLCNRKKFHATSEAAISLISWTLDKKENDCLDMESDSGNRKIKKIYNKIILLNPKSTISGFASLYHVSGTPDFKNGAVVNSFFNKHCKEIKLDSSTILQTLPLWVANCYKAKDYTEKEVIMKSGDGGTIYQEDKDFLNDCFIWSCLINSNKCISNNQIKNQLCLTQNTEADKLFKPNPKNTELLKIWQEVLESVKTTEEYNSGFNYGLHQICRDINIKVETGDYNKKNEPIMEHKYNKLNNIIKELKEQLKKFYDKYITPKLFEYELLK